MTDLAILYEHPLWFEPLFAALDRRGVDYVRIGLDDHVFDPAGSPPPAKLIFNRCAMSSFLREPEHPIFYAQALFEHWEQAGAKVLNGVRPLGYDASKARQLSLVHHLGLDIPATRAAHRARDLVKASEGLRFPVVAKADIGGAGAGIVRYDTPEDLAAAVAAGTTPAGVNGITLMQEYAPRRGDKVTRVETLGGKFLYAIDIESQGDTFDLCPADACAIGRPPVKFTEAKPTPQLIHAAERIAAAAHLDIGGIEYLIDDRDGRACFYDINALSNFVADPMTVLGWDPHETLVDWLVEHIG